MMKYVMAALFCFSHDSQLYDLMTMAFKYQVLLCPRPKDILLVSFNHMDAIRDFVKDTPSILSQVDETNKQLIEVELSLQSLFKGTTAQNYFFFFFIVNNC